MNTYRLPSLLIAILLVSALFAGLATASAAAQPNSSAQASNMKRVIFRDDDIAPYGHTLETLEAVNQVHTDKNVPVTLAIIPHPEMSYSGNELFADTDTLSYLQSLSTNPLFELAQHGYSHYDLAQSTAGACSTRMFGASPYQERVGAGAYLSEFRGRSYAEQYNSIKQGRDDITDALGVTPTTFVPPWNTGDTNTLRACTALGFTLYSTNLADFGVADATMEGIRVQAVSTEFGWDTVGEWQTGMAALTHNTDSALNSASPGTDLVILYHYWYFENADGSPDPARIALFEQYIDHLQSRGDVQFATLSGRQGLTPSAAPAVCAQDANSLDLFAKGTDGALWWKHWDGTTWSAGTSLGGYLTSDPAAVSRSAGKITVFVRGGSGSLWSKSTTDGGATWSGWNEIGGQLLAGTGPTAYAYGDRIGWLVTGTNNALYHMWDDATGRHGWENLGGYLTSSPGATSSGSGAIDVFVRGSNGALWQREYNNGWSGWTAAGGVLAPNTGPAVCSWGAGRLDVFVTGTSGVLWHWSGSWDQSLGGYTTSSPAATSPTSGVINVFVRGGSGALWQKSYNNGWRDWTSIGSI